jgi:ubiquinone/menaquinone biosynthesis C-methylase UbiE
MKKPYYYKAVLYDKYRWEYPSNAINYIILNTDLNKTKVIADYGAGTGKLMKHFINTVSKIHAIEPDENMLSILKMKEYKNVEIIGSESHNSKEIKDASIDVIMTAHALHWFDFEKTIIEFNRVMKDGGILVDVNNHFFDHSTIHTEIKEVLQKYKKNIQDMRNMGSVEGYFSKENIKKEKFGFKFKDDFDSFLGGLSSASYYPDETDKDIYYDFKEDVKKIFDENAINNEIEHNCECIVTIGSLKRIFPKTE